MLETEIMKKDLLWRTYEMESALLPLSDLSFITKLSLRNNGITNIEYLSKMVGLTKLDLMGNPIDSTLPLEKLINLTELNLFYCNTPELTGIENLTKLKTVIFSTTRSLRGLVHLEKLVNLTELTFMAPKGQSNRNNRGNQWDFLEPLISLTTLNLPDNRIVNGQLFHIDKLINLTTLNLERNRLTHGLLKISTLHNLTSLNLSRNGYIQNWRNPRYFREHQNSQNQQQFLGDLDIVLLSSLTNLTTLHLG